MMFTRKKVSRFCKQLQSHESSLPWTHHTYTSVILRFFQDCLYRCLTFVFDVCWINPLMKQLFPSSDYICFWSSFLFALTSWKILPLALWVRYFAEEGVDLTTKQDTFFSIKRKVNEIHYVQSENTTITPTLDTGWLCSIFKRTTASTPHGCQNVLEK